MSTRFFLPGRANYTMNSLKRHYSHTELIPTPKIRRDQIRNIRGGILPCDGEEIIRRGMTASIPGCVVSQKIKERLITHALVQGL